MNGTGSVGLPWVSILGFIRIATHPNALDNPLDMGGACTRIRSWTRSTADDSCPPWSLEFPRFRGHLILWENGGYDAKNKTSLSTRVSPADSRASSSRAQTR